MMTIDNLPTQLPADASEYFGNALVPLLDEYLRNPNGDTCFSRSAICRNGEIVPEFKSFLEPIIEKVQSKNIVIFGASLVSRPVIEYLAQFPEYHLHVLTKHPDQVHNSSQNVTVIEDEVFENQVSKRALSLIQTADLVISLLPAFMHKFILEPVANSKKPLITASYVSKEMEAFNEQLKRDNVLWLNEVGLDPGLDHMSAMRLIDHVKRNEHEYGRVESFVSWCGGLPAPQYASNPLGYKFSWSPKGVLMALKNPARYLADGQTVNISNVLSTARPVSLHPAFAFEGYPNRDSLTYVDKYGLDPKSLKTMFRGTLRFTGFAQFMEGMAALGFFDDAKMSNRHFKTWREAFMDSLGVQVPSTAKDEDLTRLINGKLPDWPIEKCQDFVNQLKDLHMLSDEYPFTSSRLDSLVDYLSRKLTLTGTEQDLVFMHHSVKTTNKHQFTSTLVVTGSGQHSAMSVTVGLPVAVASRLLLDGRFSSLSGVQIPTRPSVYEPILEELSKLGITFAESSRQY